MTFAAITGCISKKELDAFFPDAGVDWITLQRVPAADAYPGVTAWFDLDYTNERQRNEALSRLFPALVIVDAVTPTIGEIGYPFVRLNGWPGWPELAVHELAAPDEATAQRITALYTQLGHAFRLVPDTPGMISPRILATIINEAWYTWEEKVSTKEEIDTAMRLGTNYPLGPFEWGERIGLDRIFQLLSSLGTIEPRYAPCEAMRTEVAAQRTEGAAGSAPRLRRGGAGRRLQSD
jgi:3-hydroxybutyryl-CoA dehydrogenase